MSSEEPLVSVLIPLYNHAPYVARCLSSLVEEGYPELDVIVIDDGSTDGSFEVAESWRVQHCQEFSSFRLFRQSNRGLTKTLNKLIALANGKFVTLLASDDYLLAGGILTRVTFLRKKPQYLAVFSDCIVVDEGGNILHKSGLAEYHKGNKYALNQPSLITRELLLRWSVPGPVFLARTETYDPVKGIGNYDESLNVEDRDYYLRLLSKGVLGFIDSTVSAYRVHSGNTSSSINPIVIYGLMEGDGKNAIRFAGLHKLLLKVRSMHYRLRHNRMVARKILKHRIMLIPDAGLRIFLKLFLLFHDAHIITHRMKKHMWLKRMFI